MLRALIVFAGLVALGAAGAWFADHPGSIAMDWGGRRIETSVAVALVLLLALLLVVLLAYQLWRWLMGGPGALARRRREGRRRRGFEALSRGLVAVAAGDAGEAKKLARRTASLLDDPPLTLLLSAQAAQLDGDEAAATRHFEAMSERPETEFLGLRGLLVQARRAGDAAAALRLARRAYELRPDTPWVAEELFALEAQSGNWVRAREVTERAAKRKLLPDAAGRRRRGLALYGEALAAEDRGESRHALALARNAHDRLPDFVPATALLARLQIAAGETRRARRLLQEAWRKAPHPELAELYLTLEPGATGAGRLKALERLVAGKPAHPESRLALAAAALEAGDLARAGEALLALEQAQAQAQAQTSPEGAGFGRRACRLMAEWRERGGDAAAAAHWLRRAAALPEDEAWVCGNCGQASLQWTAHCPACGSFDTTGWRRPAGAAALPLEAIAADTGALAAPEGEAKEELAAATATATAVLAAAPAPPPEPETRPEARPEPQPEPKASPEPKARPEPETKPAAAPPSDAPAAASASKAAQADGVADTPAAAPAAPAAEAEPAPTADTAEDAGAGAPPPAAEPEPEPGPEQAPAPAPKLPLRARGRIAVARPSEPLPPADTTIAAAEAAAGKDATDDPRTLADGAQHYREA